MTARWERLVVGLLLILVAGCGGSVTPPRVATTPILLTSIPTVAIESEPPAPVVPTVVVDPTPTPAPPLLTPALALSPTATPAAVPRTRYALTADVDAVSHAVVVTETVMLAAPDASRLVFNINALQLPGVFHLLDLRVNGSPAKSQAMGVWLYVSLPSGLNLERQLEISIHYQLTLPLISPSALGWRGSLGWTPRQIDLGDWYAVLARYEPGQGWVTHTPAGIGEYQIADAADYEVTLHATGFAAEPLVLGSGQTVPCAARCFRLSGARFVAYVLSDAMQSRTATTSGGVTVTSVYFPGHYLPGRAALDVATGALDRYSQLFGDYPYSTFTLVEADFFDGMEYSGMSFEGESYYAAYDGSANNWLTAITAHETAHQWWYSLVANDQALEPWLDEALCTYAEPMYLESAHPSVVANWWHWRVAIHQPAGAVDQPIYAFAAFRPYVNAVYLRGAQMLQAMRQAVGDERFFDFLRQYTQDNAAKVATGADFWRAYASVGGNSAAIRAVFFSQP